MEKYATFLPQFHEIEENSMWWGEGFTEWTNVKKAIPLYKGHQQPNKPLNDFYYNLLDKSTVEWQTKLMKEYGIDGLVYYHYFLGEKLLLEKPAENLLKWKDIDQPFFFMWANHDWNRSWNGTRELLLKQTYGELETWEKHFKYLLPFFKDSRYVKKNNMPLFILYADFPQKEEMFTYFNNRCIEEGFSGIYLIEEFAFSKRKNALEKFKKNRSSVTRRIFFSEPAVSQNYFDGGIKRYYTALRDRTRLYLKLSILQKYKADDLYREILKEEKSADIIHGLFYSWDNTPRHGKRGRVIEEPSREMFEKVKEYLKDEDMIIINAWNEWCEGLILEPSESNGYKYLEWTREL